MTAWVTCAGIVSRVGYLADLGVDAVWLSPFYPSALADGGYDVDDYRDVDPRIGTLADFDAMITALHDGRHQGAGRHRSQPQLRTGTRGSSKRWRRRPDRRPATATSSATARDPRAASRPTTGSPCSAARPGSRSATVSGTSTCSPPEQPDLNWDNEEVREDFRTTLRFWADRGVDGFRVDVAHGLVKDLSDPVRPVAGHRDDAARRTAATRCGTATTCSWSTGTGGPSSTPTTRRASPWPRRPCIPAGGRATPPRPASARRSTSPCRRPTGDRTSYRTVIEAGVADMVESGSTTTWLLGCHDTARVAVPLRSARFRGRDARSRSPVAGC